MRSYFAELLRPWKLFSLVCGIALLIVGADFFDYPDWDVAVSLIMAIPTYLTAAWSMRVVLERRWNKLPLALLWTYISVDGLYSLYWHFQNPAVLEQMRMGNAPASLALYGVCGLVWLYQGSLKELYREVHEKTFLLPG